MKNARLLGKKEAYSQGVPVFMTEKERTGIGDAIVCIVEFIIGVIIVIAAIFFVLGPFIAAIAIIGLLVILGFFGLCFWIQSRHPDSKVAGCLGQLCIGLIAFLIIAIIVFAYIILPILQDLPQLLAWLAANPTNILILIGSIVVIVAILLIVGIYMYYRSKRIKKPVPKPVKTRKVPDKCLACNSPLSGKEEFCPYCGAAVGSD
jgi:hypothetical protein